MAFTVIVANELCSYRQLLAHAIEAARPEVEVVVVPPAQLESRIEDLRPDLVVCTCARAVVEAGTRAWIELYPGHGAVSVLCVDGRRSSVEDIELDDILRFVEGVPAAGGAEGGEAPARRAGKGAPAL